MSESIIQTAILFLPKGRLFSFALWSIQDEALSFSILTTEMNDLVTKVHARMPVILDHNVFSVWRATARCR